jgi:hypothetical protein
LTEVVGAEGFRVEMRAWHEISLQKKRRRKRKPRIHRKEHESEKMREGTKRGFSTTDEHRYTQMVTEGKTSKHESGFNRRQRREQTANS